MFNTADTLYLWVVESKEYRFAPTSSLLANRLQSKYLLTLTSFYLLVTKIPKCVCNIFGLLDVFIYLLFSKKTNQTPDIRVKNIMLPQYMVTCFYKRLENKMLSSFQLLQKFFMEIKFF